MIQNIFKIVNNKKTILIIVVLLLAIAFETFQQLYYIKRFDLYQNVEFSELLKNQFYRWILWFLIGSLLLFFIKNDIKKEAGLKYFLKYFFIIILLVLINVFIISIIQLLITDNVVSLGNFFSEYFLFYIFQKAPIYFLGYIAITIILFLNYSNVLLEIEVKELLEIKEDNDKKYNELRSANSDKSKMLTIKIGNKRKIISVDTITWLEADDYCVIVHTINKPSYSMRITLKALDNKLGNNFLRVHRKGIVNMNMVKELNLNGNPKLILTNNVEVLVSKSNIKLVNDFLKS